MDRVSNSTRCLILRSLRNWIRVMQSISIPRLIKLRKLIVHLGSNSLKSKKLMDQEESILSFSRLFIDTIMSL